MPGFDSIDSLRGGLTRERYLVDEGLATVVFLALRLKKPLLVEGEPGVGKTELAKTLASALGAPLIRLQCYEGIDVHHALYDWTIRASSCSCVPAGRRSSTPRSSWYDGLCSRLSLSRAPCS